MAGPSARVRLVISVLAALAILVPLAWLWQASLVGKELFRHEHGLPRLRRWPGSWS